MTRPTPDAGGLAQVSHRQRILPDPLTLEQLNSECEREERMLRLQYKDRDTNPDGLLPPEWEMGLKHKRRQPTSMSGALSRWSYLTHIYRVRFENLTKADPADAEEVIGKMLRREPIRVELTGRTVNVTGRSYNALLEMARHSLRMQEIEADAQRLAALQKAIVTKLGQGPTHRRLLSLTGRMGRLTGLHRRLMLELLLHRQALYAHAFTEDGAPAASLDEAPDWWVTVTPADDSRLLEATFSVGIRRLEQLFDSLPDQKDEGKVRSYGWHTLLQTIAPKLRVRPAEAYDLDLFQAVAFAHASTPQMEDME